MIFDINTKLSKGINPFNDNSAIGYTPVSDVLHRFLDEKRRETRSDTMRCYDSYVRTFLGYIADKIVYICKIDKMIAVRYLDYVYNDKKVSKRTFNNYVKFMRLLCNWCITHGYLISNPFNNIPLKKNDPKKRQIIPSPDRVKIIKYLTDSDNKYLIVCKLVYYSLVRPNEIRNLKIADVDFDNKCLHISSETAKNHHSRTPALTDDVIADLQYIKLYNRNLYIFSDNMLPGKMMISPKKFRGLWDKLRRALHFPDEYQLYSLRDTGITEMLHAGIDPLTVKQHADHHSLQMTTIYSDHIDPGLNEKIREYVPNF